MSFTKNTERNALLLICIIGLFGLLTYTFVHTGGLLARYVRPMEVGYIAAFGVEIIIAGLAWRYARANKAQRGSGFLRFALIVALTVSAFANIDEGYTVYYAKSFTWENLGQIDYIQAFIGLFATGLISLLVFAISDIIGDDVHRIAKQVDTKPEEQTDDKQDLPQPEPDGKQVDYSPIVFGVLNSGQVLGPTAMANKVGCSKATASKWINEWQTQRDRGRANGQ